ncbi:hypothetical protein PoB_004315500 [Plakobranchus ocellatus]|uniref:Uncharacterized protein n=1 Tax=Plakobranchus ocellatus TaxID=259542 RepID=A0AAV4BC42_9GAST|nr:hypothetical protein PoB_004315500 [Plakobranchus ocellatus]
MIRLEKRDMFYVYSRTLHEADGRHRAPVRPSQYPPLGIPKASAPVILHNMPTRDTKSQSSSLPVPVSPTRDTENQYSRPPSPITSSG